MKKNNIKTIIKILVTLIFMIVILNKVDIYVLFQNFQVYPLEYLFVSFILSVFTNLIGAFSLNAVYKKEKVSSIFIVTLKSNFYALALPGQLIGEASKIFLLSNKQSALSERISAVVIDKFLNAIAMVILGSCGLLISPNIHDDLLQQWMSVGLITVILCLLALKSEKVLHFLFGLVKRIVRNTKFVKKAEECLDIWLEYSNKNRELLISGIWGCAYQLTISLLYFLLGTGLGIGVSFWDYCWINAISTVILFLPVSIGGLGIREATLMGFLGKLGIDAEKALTLSVLLLGLQLLRAAIGGVLLFFDRRNNVYEKDIDNKL